MNFFIGLENFYQIIKEYEEYLHFGGFPELIQMTDKREFLSSVYQKLFYGDLIARYKIASVVTLKLMVKKLAVTQILVFGDVIQQVEIILST